MTRIYVVTGSASGIAAATSRMLTAAGHRVIGVDLKNAEVEVDLSTPQGRLEAAGKSIELSNGKIDAVIACAGLIHPTAKTVSVNYFGVTELLNELLPTLAKAGDPRVAVMSSVASLMPPSSDLVAAMGSDDEIKALAIAQGLVDTGGGAEHLIYGSTKRALSRWVRRESIRPSWAGAGIPLNAVGPGIVRTPMVAGMMATQGRRDALDKLIPMPLHGYLEAESVASLLLWLTSPENTHVTGQTIYIDGGSDAVLRGENIWDLEQA